MAGYNSLGDGGEGTFKFDSGSRAPEDNGTIIAPDVCSGRWFRMWDDGPVSVKWFGAKGDGTNDYTAINDAVSNFDEIFFPEASSFYKVNDNVTIGRDQTVIFAEGGDIKPTTGKTFTINGRIVAGQYFLFNVQSGSVIFGDAVEEVYPQWFNAKGDGTTDDRLALQRTIDAIQDEGVTLVIPSGTYRLNDTTTKNLKIEKSITIEGRGRSDTKANRPPTILQDQTGRIFHIDAKNNPLVRISNLYLKKGTVALVIDTSVTDGHLQRYSRFEHLRLDSQSDKGVEMADRNMAINASFRYINIDDASGVKPKYGFYIKGPTGSNAALFEKIRVNGTTEWAVWSDQTDTPGQNEITFLSPLIESNDGGGFMIRGSILTLVAPHFEANGAVKFGAIGRADIHLEEQASGSRGVVQVIGGRFGGTATNQQDGAGGKYRRISFGTNNVDCTLVALKMKASRDQIFGDTKTGCTLTMVGISQGLPELKSVDALTTLASGDFGSVGSAADYSQGRLRLGDHYLWVDSTGDLRIKDGAPTSDTDGTVVGTQS